MGLIIAGEDGLAVDMVCSLIMGIDPSDVKHLMLAKEKGLGIADLDEIKIVGESIEEVASEFELPSTFKN